MVTETWGEARRTRSFDMGWLAVGDGTKRAGLESAGAELDRAAGRRLVRFLGWQEEFVLARLYKCLRPLRGASAACLTECLRHSRESRLQQQGPGNDRAP